MGMSVSRAALPAVTLTVGALGVVFGGVGTSPLYALRETVRTAGGAGEAVPGGLSLILWVLPVSLTVI